MYLDQPKIIPFEEHENNCPIPDIDEFLNCSEKVYAEKVNQPSFPYKIDPLDLLMDGKFVSKSGREKKSVLHLKAIDRQKELIGKLTPKGLSGYLPPLQEAPIDEYAIEFPSPTFIELIKLILEQPPVRKDAPPFKFSTDPDALNHNAEILRKHDYSLHKIVQGCKNNVISPGSEFRETQVLGPLLHAHPYWNDFKCMLEEGIQCKFTPLSEEQRIEDLNKALDRGNHKSAESKPDLLESLVQDDIQAGFQLPIPKEIVRKIDGAVLAPYGIAEQFTINEFGERIEKNRLIHDQSFDFSDGNSVNHRLITDDFHELRYGRCLLQIIHYAHALRLAQPKKRIVAAKFDLKSAYRRAHLHGLLAVMAMTIVGTFALISLRLPFGGTYCVYTWCVISEYICDLANALLRCKYWGTNSFDFELKERIPDPVLLQNDENFGEALAPDVLVDPDPRGKTFCYIDDLIPVGYYDENWGKLRYAVAIAMSIFGRPVHKDEPLPRDHLLSVKKLAAEGGLEEIKICLGWNLNFRALRASLTEDKYAAWSNDLREHIAKKSATMADLDSLIGRLGHSCFVLKMGYHFLHRLRAKIDRKKNQKTKVHYSERDIRQLKLWSKLLTKANEGVSFNLIVCRRPTKIYISDSCPYGMGGFSVLSGRAWRLKLPADLIGKVSNNLLEYMAEVICIWIDVLNGDLQKYDCILALGDNTSAIGWLYLTRFCGDGDEPHEETSDKIANLITDIQACLYGQHFKGKLNWVADSLSRDHHIPDKVLTQLLLLCCPEQMPENFHIYQVPHEIVSWVYRTLRLSSKPSLDPKEQMPSTIGAGLVGKPFCEVSNSKTIRSWIQSQKGYDPQSLSALLKPSEMASLQEETRKIWQQAQSERPWTKWQRSSMPTAAPTPSSQTKIN